MLQTGPDDFVEIQLGPSGTVIKLAENTSLVYLGPQENGPGSPALEMLYGRMRIVSGTGNRESVLVRTGNAALRLGEGDIGIDYMVLPGSTGAAQTRPVLRVYGFAGSAEIIPSAAPGESVVSSIGIVKGESVSTEWHTPLFLVEKKSLEEDMLLYWDRHNFKGRPPLPMPPTSLSLPEPEIAAPPPPVVETRIEYLPPDYRPFRRGYLVKNISVAGGLLCIAAGVVMQGMYYQGGMLPEAAAVYGGYSAMGLGASLLITSLLYNPKAPVSNGPK
jgi:hypothetical protein